ncbi:hypothetical protein BpHYR1_043552 [Brachionus plicatilis]|uniref:Uncharacterized protein n=1 Tax=Brachionus plicatilis TaxID=10195 RepID=A0A3M7PXV7_BRAPC|nr:hypothetical protein BpHYR1_043552 [Brachionus plicatilis]
MTGAVDPTKSTYLFTSSPNMERTNCMQETSKREMRDKSSVLGPNQLGQMIWSHLTIEIIVDLIQDRNDDQNGFKFGKKSQPILDDVFNPVDESRKPFSGEIKPDLELDRFGPTTRTNTEETKKLLTDLKPEQYQKQQGINFEIQTRNAESAKQVEILTIPTSFHAPMPYHSNVSGGAYGPAPDAWLNSKPARFTKRTDLETWWKRFVLYVTSAKVPSCSIIPHPQVPLALHDLSKQIKMLFGTIKPISIDAKEDFYSRRQRRDEDAKSYFEDLWRLARVYLTNIL